MEQKTYWWRVLVVVFAVVLFSYGFIVSNVIDGFGWYYSYVDSFDFASVAFFCSSLFLFFVSDAAFLKWFKFTFIWWFFSIILIILTPESYNSFLNLSPDRESVSIWLSVLFVIISLAKLVWDTKTLRHGGEK